MTTKQSLIKNGAGKDSVLQADQTGEQLQCSRSMVVPQQHVCGITDVGKMRPTNEDAMYCSADGRILIVADGMGGQAAGGLASSLSVEATREIIEAGCLRCPTNNADSAISLLVSAVAGAQERILQGSSINNEWKGMGSTLLIAWIVRNQIYVAHVGDVRCYVLNKCGLEQITQDHSLVAQLVRDGHLLPEDARDHPQKGVIYRAIGMNKAADPDISQRVLQDGDRILLCSDGLWEVVSDEEIGEVLGSDGSARQLATVLVDRANARGGPDNITVVVYEYSAEARTL
jgi:serine/threonine protein phosphatase PrpC